MRGTSLKRCVLFAGDDQERNGGWGDFKRSADTALAACPKIDDSFTRDWWHVIDLETGAVVASYPLPDKRLSHLPPTEKGAGR